MNAPLFYLILAIVMPGREPDIETHVPYTSIEECWTDARAFVAHGVPKSAPEGAVGVRAACFARKEANEGT